MIGDDDSIDAFLQGESRILTSANSLQYELAADIRPMGSTKRQSRNHLDSAYYCPASNASNGTRA
jgi:hypothetical protein